MHYVHKPTIFDKACNIFGHTIHLLSHTHIQESYRIQADGPRLQHAITKANTE